jgi:Peptidase family M23
MADSHRGERGTHARDQGETGFTCAASATADGPDLPVGETDSRYQAGNHVVIDIGGARYILMGHLRAGSVQVRVGDRVRTGQPIARVGNTDDTSEPHVHIQAQTRRRESATSPPSTWALCFAP